METNETKEQIIGRIADFMKTNRFNEIEFNYKEYTYPVEGVIFRLSEGKVWLFTKYTHKIPAEKFDTETLNRVAEHLEGISEGYTLISDSEFCGCAIR